MSHFNDYFDGSIVKLKNTFDLNKLEKIKDSIFEQTLCSIKGRWTGKI
jgi:hypothetical protein